MVLKSSFLVKFLKRVRVVCRQPRLATCGGGDVNTVNNLDLLYADLGRLNKAEKMH